MIRPLRRSSLIGWLLLACLALPGCVGSGENVQDLSVQTDPLRCMSQTKARVTAQKPTVQVLYTEPTTTLQGQPLTNLAKTTIYFDLGDGLVRAKDVPASKPTGGGKILETITIPFAQEKEAVATICVTASDRRGSEGPPTK